MTALRGFPQPASLEWVRIPQLMPAQTATRTHCPTCGVKLPEKQLSLCLFCASPIDLPGAGEKPAGENPNMARLARMPEHKDYAEAIAWDPPPELELEQANATLARHAKLLGAAAVVLALPAILSRPAGVDAVEHWVLRPTFVVGAALALFSLWKIVGALRVRARITSLPLLKRPVVVNDRRSETAMGVFSGKTVYFFDLEFADGNSAEFRYPGRGTSEDPLVAGYTGIAYTRGPNLLGFKQLRG